MKPRYPTAKDVDVLLLLEGTYPFVRGGVSSWVHALILGFPGVRFGVAFLGSEPGAYQGVQYDLPANLVHLEAHYLQDRGRPAPEAAGRPAAPVFHDLHEMHKSFQAPEGFAGGEAFHKVIGHLMQGNLAEDHFHHSKEAWDMLTSLYRERSTDPSFVDYFWTVRSMHEPIWALARIARTLIPARCYHSVSTGYAGFLGAMLAGAAKKPFILSEHGLYTKERKIDLFHSAWIREGKDPLAAGAPEGGYIRNLWIRFFEVLGRAAYASADPIVSLYEGIRLRQVEDGAAAERTRCIPNGIRLERFAPLRARQALPPEPIFVLLGRVVPIKDIKTFIRAMRTVRNRVPGGQGWIVGPTEEDPTYHAECQALVEMLGLGEGVRFLGFRNVEEILPQAAVLVLSSISEALPLTLLEGFAAGVPAVATDVGSCRQLIQGRAEDADDTGLGAAGRIVDIGDPAGLAEAILGLYGAPEEWESARAAGIARVERYYTDTRMLGSYAAIYAEALKRPLPEADRG